MRAREIEKLREGVDIIDLLNHTGNQVLKKENGWVGKCPFHAGGTDEILEVDPAEKTFKCGWCEAKGDLFDYVRALMKYENGQAYEYVKKYLDEKKPRPGYEVLSISKHEIKIAIGDREYQLTGVNLRRLNDFSMTLKVSFRDGFLIDRVNLGRVKSQDEFIGSAQDKLFISREIIESDMNALIEAVEKLQRENIERIEEECYSGKKVYEVKDIDEKRAMEYLAEHDVLNEDLIPDTERIGYVGDDLSKKLLYLACTSRLLKHPISVLSIANSSAGKSFGQENISSLFPPDEVFSYTRLTPKSLSHYQRQELRHKILCVDELSGIEEEAMYQVRSLLSRGFLSVGFTHIDRSTGRLETMSREIEGPISFITSATHEALIDDETRNRFLILPVDESARQNKLVVGRMIEESTKKGAVSEREIEKIKKKHRIIQKCLRPVKVYIPENFSDGVSLASEKLSFKRKFKNYRSLLYSIALLRQYQRKVYTEKNNAGELIDYIYLTRKDIEDVNALVARLFSQYPGELNPVDEKMLRDIEGFSRKKSEELKIKIHEVKFTRRDIRDYSGWDHTPCRRAFEKLEEMEYLVRVYGMERSRHYYQLVPDEARAPGKEDWFEQWKF